MQELLREASGIIESLEMHLHVPRVSRLLSMAAASHASLTPRETVVLGHVTQGLSNRQIAVVLGVAPATVKRHVSNILSKTGFSNRTELARYATRLEMEQGRDDVVFGNGA